MNVILLRCTFRDIDVSQVSSFVPKSHSVTVWTATQVPRYWGLNNSVVWALFTHE